MDIYGELPRLKCDFLWPQIDQEADFQWPNVDQDAEYQLQPLPPVIPQPSHFVSHQIDIRVSLDCEDDEDDETTPKVLIEKPVRQSSPGGSRAESIAGDFKGVYNRQGIRGDPVDIHPMWKDAIWLGTFNSAQEAACARDAVVFYCSRSQSGKYNYPELQGTFPPLPPHLQPDSVEDREAIINFVQEQAHEAACRAKNTGKGAGKLNLGAPSNESEEIEHVDTNLDADPVITPAIPANKIDAKLEESDTMNEAEVTRCASMCQPSEELAGDHECTNDPESEDDRLSGCSSNESQAEVTGDSPCQETNSNCAGRKRESIDEGDLMTMLAPLIKKQVEDALKSTLLPLVAVLQSREEDEQKHRQQLLALEEQKLALKEKKLLCKRHRVG